MIEIHCESDGMKASDRLMLEGMRNIIYDVADKLSCEDISCEEKKLIAIVGGPPVQAILVFVCHAGYLEKINEELPDYLRLKVQNPSSS